MINLSFGQNDYPMGGSFWTKDSLISHILFELCLFRYLAQSIYFRDTLYYPNIFIKSQREIMGGSNFYESDITTIKTFELGSIRPLEKQS